MRRRVLSALVAVLAGALVVLGADGGPALARVRLSAGTAAAWFRDLGLPPPVATPGGAAEFQALIRQLVVLLEREEALAGWYLGGSGVPGAALPAATAPATQAPAGVPAVVAVSPASGSAGQTVLVRGSGFLGATGVQFGGAPAAFRVLSDRWILARVPRGSGTVDVVVSSPAGGSAPAPGNRFTYVDAGALQAAVAATVRLDIRGDGSEAACSGVLVSSSPAVVLTAGHCVDWLSAPGEAAYQVAFPVAGEGPLPAHLLFTDAPHDLAALVLDAEPPVAPVTLRSDAPAAGETVYDVGYPGGRARPQVRVGQVLLAHAAQVPVSGSEVPDVTVTDLAVQPGESGGPLLDASGRLAGILTGGSLYRGRGFRASATSVYTWAPEVARFAARAEAAAGSGTAGPGA